MHSPCDKCQGFRQLGTKRFVIIGNERYRDNIGQPVVLCSPDPSDPKDCLTLFVQANPGICLDPLPDGQWVTPGAHNPKNWGS